MRRDDKASSSYSGNKFYKLFFHLQLAFQMNKSSIVTFGGAYSNHIHALAALGREVGIPTVGIIRGQKPQRLSPTLHDAQLWGMKLFFLNRQDYQTKNIQHLEKQLNQEYGDYYLLPEGGGGDLGMRGCQVIGESIAQNFSGAYTVCSAMGTGTTLAGIIAGSPQRANHIGVNVLKGEDSLSRVVQSYLDQEQCSNRHWSVVNGYHCGGYAKAPAHLLAFMNQVEVQNDVLLEPVYSAKMLWAVDQLAQSDFWQRGSTIVAIHGGGLQGRRGFSL